MLLLITGFHDELPKTVYVHYVEPILNFTADFFTVQQ